MDAEWVDPAQPRGSSDWVDPSPPPPPSVHDSAGGGDAYAYVYERPGYDREFSPVGALGHEGEWTGPVTSDVHSIDEASAHMAAHLVEKYNSGQWYATDVCKLACLAKEIGGTGPIAALAKRPGLPTGHYNDHVKHILGTKGQDETFEDLELPCSDSGDGSRISYKLAVIPPHEMLNKEMAEDGVALNSRLAKHVRDEMVPPVYEQHKVARASGNKAQPIALYMDKVPTTKKDAVLGVWVYFLMSSKRHLDCVLKSSWHCHCGCRG